MSTGILKHHNVGHSHEIPIDTLITII